MRFASASSCCMLRKRNEGSGLMLNGFWLKPKNALYIPTFPSSATPGSAGFNLPFPILRGILRRPPHSLPRRWRLWSLLGFFRLLVLPRGFHGTDQHMCVAAFQTRLAFHGAVRCQVGREPH